MLQGAINSPEDSVTDDLPTPRSEFNEWWEQRLKPFVDLRSFLHQRQLILKHPELSYCVEAPEKNWKKPFEFALSASLLTFGFCVILSVLFHTAFPDPDTRRDWIANSIRSEIKLDTAQERRLNRSSPAYAALEKDKEQAYADLQDHVNTVTVPHGNLFATVGIFLAVYLIGVLYPALVRHTRARAAPRASSARKIVYYYFASRTFWPIFAFIIATAAMYFAERYSVLNMYTSVKPFFAPSSGPPLVALYAFSTIVYIAFVYAVVATPIALHKCAKRLPELIGATDASSRRILYWGLHATVVFAFIASFFIASFVIGAYAALDTATDQIHHMTSAAFLASP